MEKGIKMLTNKQKGFTLLEVVVVIAVLGVLSAVATPKIIGFAGDAREVSIKSVAAELTTASDINYTTRGTDSSKGITIAMCSDIEGALEDEALPTGYTFGGTIPAVFNDDFVEVTPAITSEGMTLVAPEAKVTCTIKTNSSPQLVSTFTIRGTI